jgi:hypothetical protein
MSNVIHIINNQFNLQLPEDEFMLAFENYLTNLAVNDISKLYYHLNRIDVFEHKLKAMLHENKAEPVGRILAALIIERLVEKNANKENFKNASFDSAEERW